VYPQKKHGAQKIDITNETAHSFYVAGAIVLFRGMKYQDKPGGNRVIFFSFFFSLERL
jgi:hypothetical protein